MKERIAKLIDMEQSGNSRKIKNATLYVKKEGGNDLTFIDFVLDNNVRKCVPVTFNIFLNKREQSELEELLKFNNLIDVLGEYNLNPVEVPNNSGVLKLEDVNLVKKYSNVANTVVTLINAFSVVCYSITSVKLISETDTVSTVVLITDNEVIIPTDLDIYSSDVSLLRNTLTSHFNENRIETEICF